jgi:hypothetical protein
VLTGTRARVATIQLLATALGPAGLASLSDRNARTDSD